MTGITAVGIDDDLAAGKAGIAVRTADDKAAGRVDENPGIVIEQSSRKRRFNNVFDDIGTDLLQCDGIVVLTGHDDGIHTHRFIVVILNGHLRFSVGAEIRQRAVFAHLGKAFCQLMGKRNRQRHKLGRFVAGKAEDETLVAGSDIEFIGHFAVFGFKAFIDAHGNIRRLAVDGMNDAAGIAIEAVFGAVIADLTHGIAHDLLNINISGCGDFAGNHHKAGGSKRFAGHARHRIGFEVCVENSVADGIADFIGMSFGHRFGGKKSFAHCVFLSVIRLSVFSDVFLQRNKKPCHKTAWEKESLIFHGSFAKAVQEVAPCHIDRLPGIFGPVPSASLDKLDCI